MKLFRVRRSVFGVVAVALLAVLPACRIGSGFDSAEKRRNLVWDDEPSQVSTKQAPDPEEVAVAKQSPPIIYLLVAG